MEIEFTRPMLLLLFLVFPAVVFFHFFVFRNLKARAFRFANFETIRRVTGSGFITNKKRTFVSKNLPLLIFRLFALGLLILGMSGITLILMGKTVGNDIIIALDTSSSMLADDFQPNRLEAAKVSLVNFFDNQTFRMKLGLVTFSSVSYIQSPLTEKKDEVIDKISNITTSEISGTDLSEAIITSVNIVQNTCCDQDLVVLITDGRSTTGSPVENAVRYAKDKSVKVYTLGIATKAGGRFLNLESVSTLDEDSLKYIANYTSGQYWQIKDTISFKEALNEIVQPRDEKLKYHYDIYFALAGLLILVCEWILSNTKYNSIP